ncbi:tripartite tricarboxylate transporter substrate binding protein [Roseomonas hellenica]|uniref:Tripartite tricarboxylate transporter substrate binding protein n=1 Tax=Plastoroseomonas hellenica TaxID=2687306 RepID=A0ABS5F233_9PROT|nr:tripartite tricarboxylate transporter substrate binding protein [Plastoroseomonas hellenica]MBR0666533.1 tripartite tricarboxylate transporter substrate binding protein [Plastoroseomonas hellenica]
MYISNSTARRRAVLAGSLGLLAAGRAGAAAAFPTRALRMVVNFPPGGTVDRTARALAEHLPAQLGQPVVVENRGGASGSIGALAVARAPADGHTLLIAFSSITINPALQRELPFDTLRDLRPVARLVDTPQILVVHPSLGARTVPELIAVARRQAQPLRYASVGIGTPGHLAGEMFAQQAGIPLEHVPYRGVGEAAPDVLAGRVPLHFVSFPSGHALVGPERLLALGVASASRMSTAPQVPTIAEQGLPGYAIAAWVGAFLPAATPDAVLERWHAALQAALEAPVAREALAAAGAEPARTTPAEFVAQVAEEIPFWQRFVAERGIARE